MATGTKRTGNQKSLKNDACRIGMAANTLAEMRNTIGEEVEGKLSREDDNDTVTEITQKLEEMENELWELQESIFEEGGFDEDDIPDDVEDIED